MMLRFTYALLTVACVFALTVCFPRPAYAYVDPGSGLLLCQSAGSVFAGLMFYFRRQLRLFFHRTASSPEQRSSNS
jgi:hypothetical protein